VIAYAPRMMMVSVISLHPLQFGTPAGRARTNPSPYPGTAIALFSTLAHAVMIIMLLLLPEARGRVIASLEPEAPGAFRLWIT
jgi:hypothetical protein